MDSSDEKVPLESCFFLLNHHREQIKRKRKRTWVREILKKEWNKEFTITYCKKCVSMTDNRISGYLYNEFFSESNEEKYTVFQSMAWSLIVHKNTIKNHWTALQVFFFHYLSLCILYFFFYKGKDTSTVPQPSVQHLYMISSFSFIFINALVTST